MGVNPAYLLDTHVLLWLWGDPGRVDGPLRDELAHPHTRLLVSAVSAMEVATKTRLGKLDVGRALVATWAARTAEIAAEELPLTMAHALLGGTMVWENRDPFDRLLVAQALTEGVPLISADQAMTQVLGLRVVDPRRVGG